MLTRIALIAPMIKAMQELVARDEANEARMAAQQEQIDALLARLAALEPGA